MIQFESEQSRVMILKFLILVCFSAVYATAPCQKNWYNHCKENSECCSGFCFRGKENTWAEGVCKPKDLTTTAPCYRLWYNHCTNNSQCCSGLCFRGKENTWQEGVCQPKKEEPLNDSTDLGSNSTIIENCLSLWDNKCTRSIDCCSGYCDKGPESMWLYGICKSREVSGTKKLDGKECRKTWDNHCKNDIECCGNNCFMGKDKQWEFGVCQPQQEIEEYSDIRPPSKLDESKCYPMFYEGCRYDSQCCHNLLCDRKKDVTVGTCKPMTALKILNAQNEWIECFENWYEYCTKDEECCSGICQQFDKPENASNLISFGACVPDVVVVPIELVQEILANHSKKDTGKKPNSQLRTKRLANPADMKNDSSSQGLLRTKRAAGAGGKRVICYLGSWANYKPGKGKFVIEDIDASLCTHVVYGFAKLESNKITAFDPWLDLSKKEPGGGLNAYHRFNTKLKKKNSGIKTIIAIGGWNEGSEKYSAMASSASSRQTFADSVVKFLDKYKFDGLDIDWEYPSARGGKASDKENLNQLLKLLRSKLRGKLLTIAVAANPRTVMTGYDVPTIVGLVDYISVMSYDYHGAFDDYTGHNAPLYPREDDEDLTFNVRFGINYWLAAGVPPEKINIGLPLYGRVVQLANEGKHGLMQKTVGPGANGTYSAEAGVLYYREICKKFGDKSWIKEWDSISLVPYMYKVNQWISYDNEQSLGLKVQFAMQANLGGIMFWALEGDDFANECRRGKYSLLKSAKGAMSHVIQYNKEQEEKKKKDAKCSKSAIDGVAFLSQLKSLWEVITGKSHCAKKTQENFTKKAPLISQIRSAVEAASGDLEAARQTQMTFLKNLEEMVDSTPILGHAKAAIHCTAGQLEKCKEVATSATRPIFVVAGGVAGGLAGGPAGAVTGGIAGGTAFDGIKTGIDSATNHKYTPSGNIQSLGNLFGGKANPSEGFDTVVGVLGDALGGRGGGLTKGGKKIGIKKEKPKGKRCKRAPGQCTFFNDLENFGPVPDLRVVVESNNGPPRHIQRNPNAKNRVEYVSADIKRQHLKITNEGQKGVGSATNKDTRDYSKDMNGPIPKGYEGNDAGHIIGNQLGGSGKDTANIIPQSSHFNRGTWKAEVETLVHDLVKVNGQARYTVKPIYDSPTDTRPSSIRFKIESAGREFSGDVVNPILKKSDIPHLKDKDYDLDLKDIEYVMKP